MHIEIPKKEDMKQINELILQVHKMHIKWNPIQFKDEKELITTQDLEKMIEEKRIYVAKDKIIEGYIIISIKEKKDVLGFWNSKTLSIDAICVNEQKTRNGIGKSLIEHIKEIAKNESCKSIELTVYKENENAIKFYESIGMEVKNIKYMLKVD